MMINKISNAEALCESVMIKPKELVTDTLYPTPKTPNHKSNWD